MIDKLNNYLGIIIGVFVVVFMIYKLFLGIIYKIGGHKKIDEFNDNLKVKNFESKEKKKLIEHYQDKVLSISDLYLISKEDIENKLKDNKNQFCLKVKIGEQYDNIIECFLFLEKEKEDENYIVKNVDVKDMKNITAWQNN